MMTYNNDKLLKWGTIWFDKNDDYNKDEKDNEDKKLCER